MTLDGFGQQTGQLRNTGSHIEAPTPTSQFSQERLGYIDAQPLAGGPQAGVGLVEIQRVVVRWVRGLLFGAKVVTMSPDGEDRVGTFLSARLRAYCASS